MNVPFFLFPGLACNARLFSFQKQGLAPLCDVIVPEWLEPNGRETLPEFAMRWEESVWQTYFENGPYALENGCFIGGLSFGGMVAPIVGERLHTRGVPIHQCFRISTVRCGDETPNHLRWLWRSLNLLPGGGWNMAKLVAWFFLHYSGKNASFARREVHRQVLESPVLRCKNVLRMLCAWHAPLREYPFPIFQIHGRDDSLLPLRYTHPDVVFDHAGHCLTLTRSEKLNDTLRRKIQKLIIDN
ncbi:MAG: hypothetical protein Q4D98_07830 [Planctomycetia bacterium]|nr:hypothetical protein [Planctomycetia bacterium]